MATSAVIPVSEYLDTTHRPHCDYIDGQVQERNVGEYDHANVQFGLATYLRNRAQDWKIRIVGENRVQVSETRFRIPDICILSAEAPKGQIVRHAPMLCIEILSPRDTVNNMRDRVHDYLGMGVPQVWLLDPKTRTAIVCQGNITVEQSAGLLSLPGSPVAVSLEQIFSVLDEG